MTDLILFHTDAPDLVLARDEFNTAYLCLLLRLDAEGHYYFAVKISSGRLSDLRNGKIDLRTAFKTPEQPIYFRGHVPPDEKVAISLEPVSEVPEDWFPREGFLLSAFEDEVADESVVAQQAAATNGAVIICRMNPPEARGVSPRVSADKLAGAIRKFQELVKQSAKSSLAGAGQATKRNVSDDAYALQVVAFSEGSFNIHFESKDHANLFGESLVGAAMQKIDALMQVTEAPIDQIVDALKPHRGAVLAAYHDLLKFIGKNDLPLSYRWSEPALNTSRFSGMSVDSAKAIAAVIEDEKTLTTEEKTFTGRFTSVQTDRQPFSWTARDAEDERHTGHVHESTPTVLTDVRIRTQEYVFTCEQRLVSTPSGDPVYKLFLVQVTPAGKS